MPRRVPPKCAHIAAFWLAPFLGIAVLVSGVVYLRGPPEPWDASAQGIPHCNIFADSDNSGPMECLDASAQGIPNCNIFAAAFDNSTSGICSIAGAASAQPTFLAPALHGIFLRVPTDATCASGTPVDSLPSPLDYPDEREDVATFHGRALFIVHIRSAPFNPDSSYALWSVLLESVCPNVPWGTLYNRKTLRPILRIIEKQLRRAACGMAPGEQRDMVGENLAKLFNWFDGDTRVNYHEWVSSNVFDEILELVPKECVRQLQKDVVRDTVVC
jgi:hypothetical protein